MKIKMRLQVELRDKNGKVVKKIITIPHSYIRQFMDLLYEQIAQAASTSIRDTINTSRSVILNASNLKGNAGAGIDTFGIQVGSSTSPPSISDYKLGVQILNGAAPNLLSYGAVSVGIVAIVDSVASFTIARTFTNNSGSNIDVHEVALVLEGYAAALYHFLCEHTLLDFTINNGTSGTVTYTLSVSV